MTSTVPSNMAYTMSKAEESQIVAEFTPSSSPTLYCSQSDIVYTMSVSPAATWITFDDSSRLVSWYMSGVIELAIYTVTVTGTITTWNGDTHTQDTSFTITTAYPLCSETPEDVVITAST